MKNNGLGANLLEGGDFGSLSQDVQVNLNDIEYTKETIDNIADNIKNDDKVDDR